MSENNALTFTTVDDFQKEKRLLLSLHYFAFGQQILNPL